jgi:hypothetical protein
MADVAGNGESARILREMRDILDRSTREAAEDRKQAAEDRRQAARDRKEFGVALVLLAKVGKRIEEKLDMHTRLLRQILSILKTRSNGRLN